MPLESARGRRRLWPVAAGLFGHELAGVVMEIGPDVTEFAVGDHAVGSLVQYCEHCAAYLAARAYQCLNPEKTQRLPNAGPRLPHNVAPVTQAFGARTFAERARVHENEVVKVPDSLPFPQLSILGYGSLTSAAAAVSLAGARPGDAVAVIGIGGVGLNVITRAGRIIAIDTQPTKDVLARKFGATDFIDSGKGDSVAKVRELADISVDQVFERIGLKSTSEQAIKMTRKGGGAYMLGVHKPDQPIAVDALIDLVTNQVTERRYIWDRATSSTTSRSMPTCICRTGSTLTT